MTIWIAIAVCLIMAVLTATKVWKANRGGVTALWLVIALLAYCINGLTVSYKAVVLMLNR